MPAAASLTAGRQQTPISSLMRRVGATLPVRASPAPGDSAPEQSGYNLDGSVDGSYFRMTTTQAYPMTTR